MRRMRFVCPITKNTDARSEYVILAAFPRQRWLRERAPLLRYTYITCLGAVIYMTVIPTFLAGDPVTVILCVCR